MSHGCALFLLALYLTVNSKNIRMGFYAKSHENKPSGNGEIAMSFTDVSKSYPRR